MKIEGKFTVGVKPEMQFVGARGTMKVTLSVVENYRKKVGDEWVDNGSSWFKFETWGDKAKEVLDLNLSEGDWIEIKGVHKINKVQKENQKAAYFPVYNIYEIELLNKKQ
jgi:single-stranded DNA-binding protein